MVAPGHGGRPLHGFVECSQPRFGARRRRRAPKRGLTLQPGPDTPLWNELVRQVQPLLKKRGTKAQLGRLLGVPRQRIHVCLKAQRGAFDAERVLLLLAWLRARRQGRELLT